MRPQVLTLALLLLLANLGGATVPFTDSQPSEDEMYHAVSVDIGEGGEARVDFRASFPTTNEPARFDFYLIELPSTLLGLFPVRQPALNGAAVQADGVQVDGAISVRPGLPNQAGAGGIISMEGRFAFVYVAKAPDVSLPPPTVTLTNASVIDETRGGAESVHALRVTDFQGGLAATGPFSHAAVDATAQLEIQHSLLALFDCGESEVSRCTVGLPDGSTRPHHQAGLQAGGPSGSWSFHIDRSVDSGLGERPYRLFAADVQLPPG